MMATVVLTFLAFDVGFVCGMLLLMGLVERDEEVLPSPEARLALGIASGASLSDDRRGVATAVRRH
jgi:hypothetical protein